MTPEQFKFFDDLMKVVSRYGNHGPKPDQYSQARTFVEDAGLFYDDATHTSSRDNPVVHAVVQLGSYSDHMSVGEFFSVFKAMEYYLRKKAEEEVRRLNTHEV